MAPKSKQGVLSKVHAACAELHLEKVKNKSWAALREAECALSLDLQVDIEHVSSESLFALAKSLEPIRTPELGIELWQWLAQSESGGRNSVPRIRALLVMLGQVCGNATELVGAAGAAYLALLTAQGADQQWSVLFQPGIFRQLLRALRGLRRGDLKPRKEKKDAQGGAVEEDVAMEADEDKVEEEAAVGILPYKEALELMGRMSTFFLERGLGSSAEASALVVEEVATLMLRPLDDHVARHASSALGALVARAGGADDVRRVAAAAIRATLPAMLMTQERLNSFQGAIPRPIQLARNTALNFVCGLIRNHPELLNPQAPPPPPAPVDEEGAEAPKKRGRKKGKRSSEDDEAEEEEDEGAEEDEAEDAKAAAAGGEAGEKAGDKADGEEGADGEKKSRRRRPRGNGVDDPVVALLELLCILTPDRSEWRSYSADSIITLLCQAADVERRLEMMGRITTAVTRRTTKKTADPAWEGVSMEVDAGSGVNLPLCETQDNSGEGTLVAPLDSAPQTVAEPPSSAERFMSFLERILESERVSCRVLATEVAVTSLERSGQLARKGNEDSRAELVRKLLLALTRRCSDAVPTVRSRALGGVATAMQYLAKCGKSLTLLQRIALEQSDPQYIDLPGMFRSASMDEKPIVRKAALNLFDAVIVILREPLGLEADNLAAFFDVNVLASLSADESILVRKSCVSSLAMLLRTCPQPLVCNIWVKNVLPLVLDVELSVAERALDELEAAVLNPLAESAEARVSKRGGGEAAGLPVVLTNLDSEAVEYLQRGLKQVSKRNEGKLPQRFVDSLVQMVQDCVKPLPLQQWPMAVWSMLEEVTTIEPSAIGFDLILDAWMLFSTPSGGKRKGLDGLAAASCTAQRNSSTEGVLGTKILHVLGNLVSTAKQDRTQELMDSLCGALSNFTAPTSMVRALMCTIEQIEDTWKAKKLYAQRAQERAAWRSSFLKSIHAMLSEYVRPDGPQDSSIDPRALSSALFTLGELALMDMSSISEGLIMQVQTIATNTIFRDSNRIETDPAARGQAFATLGKFCLKKDILAKKSVELLVLHLNTNESFVVRNNVLIALGDLCIHYTSLVDRFVPCMTGLLRDPNELLRKQAAMILASLLSEDFIKLRGSIMLRFLYVLSDPSEPVRSFVECVFARILHVRNSTMFSQSFLDVICALNGWAGLPNFQGATGNEEFSLQRFATRRAMIYRFMLTLMSNDQKFNVCAQIVTTLLAAFVDAEEKIDLPRTIGEPAGQALSDGLALLCCKEMRICFTTQRAGQDEDGEAEGGGDKASAEAARGVLSSILKRNMCENIVPVLIQLKNLMEARHSPFLRQLRHCLREILRDFKDDLKDMLAGDAQLATEIAFDLQAQDATPLKDLPERQERPPLPHLGGASRRFSLHTMMKTPTTAQRKSATPLTDLESPVRGNVVGSVIPKARRASTGSATRRSCAEEIQLDSSPRPQRASDASRDFTTPQRESVGSPKQYVELPVVASQEAAAALPRGGKRRRVQKGAEKAGA